MVLSLFSPKITKVDLEKLWEVEPKRYRIRDQHCLRKWEEKGTWTVQVPFLESVGNVFQVETSLRLKKASSGRFWLEVDNTQASKVREFEKKYLRTVFLRSLMDCCICLDLIKPSPTDEYTKIGQAFTKAKYEYVADAKKYCIEKLCDFITSTPFYSTANLICAVPPCPTKHYDLPTDLADCISKQIGLSDASKSIGFLKKKPSLKVLELGEKWDTLDSIGVNCDSIFRGRSVIIIDDLYQSGATMHFVASKIYQAKASAVYGLSIVKSARDTDNQ